MRTRLILMITLMILSVALCAYSLFYVRSAMDELDELRLSAQMHAENNQMKEAEADLAHMLTLIERKSGMLEVLTPHDDLHEMTMQLTDAKISLSINDIDDFQKAIILFGENVEHIRTHEQLVISNIF